MNWVQLSEDIETSLEEENPLVNQPHAPPAQRSCCQELLVIDKEMVSFLRKRWHLSIIFFFGIGLELHFLIICSREIIPMSDASSFCVDGYSSLAFFVSFLDMGAILLTILLIILIIFSGPATSLVFMAESSLLSM